MQVLVTGITGFIGRHLRKALQEADYNVIGVSHNPQKIEKFEQAGIPMRRADLWNPHSWEGITKGIDIVLHLAAIMDFHTPLKQLYEPNVLGTIAFAKDACQHEVQHFIYTSSTEALGPVEDPPAKEDAPYTPTYAYGVTKMLAEKALLKRYQDSDFPLTIVRPTGVFGPGDTHIGLSTIKAVANGNLTYFPGSGHHLIHFTYVKDVVQGFLKVLSHREESVGEIFHIASDDYDSYLKTFTKIAYLLDVEPPQASVPIKVAKFYVCLLHLLKKLQDTEEFFMHPSTIEDMTVDRAYSNEKAKRLLNFSPEFSFEEGMRETIQWIRKHGLL